MAKIYVRKNGKQGFDYWYYKDDPKLEGINVIHLELDVISYRNELELMFVNGKQIFDEIKIESTFKEFYYPFLEKMRKEEERNRRKMPNSAFSRRA